MKNRKLWITILFAAVCAVVILAVLLIGYHKKTDTGAARSFDTLAEAVEWAEFSLQCTDRLNGMLDSDYTADKTAITVTYREAGYLSKTLLTEEEQTESEPGETEEDRVSHEINGVTVWFTGEENAVTKAEWAYNGFAYVISLTGQSVTAETMTDYVLSIR